MPSGAAGYPATPQRGSDEDRHWLFHMAFLAGLNLQGIFPRPAQLAGLVGRHGGVLLGPTRDVAPPTTDSISNEWVFALQRPRYIAG